VLNESAWGSDDDVWIVAYKLLLLINGLSADDQGHLEGGAMDQFEDLLEGLDRQVAGGGQNQSACAYLVGVCLQLVH